MSFKITLFKAVEEFNRYRAPEAKAELLSVNDCGFTVRFSGPFCYTCGFYDYFDDLRVILEENGLNTEIVRIVEIDEGAVVEFKPVRGDEG